MTTDSAYPRRRFLVTGAAAAAGLTLGNFRPATAQPLAPTPECKAGGEPTARQTEGPYFKTNSPQRSDLVEAGIGGQPLTISGLVLTRGCAPIARALIEVWQADDHGDYDNRGFRLRGHLFTDAAGRYSFRTIVPGVYPGRTRHIHVKVQAPDRPVLTTQLYFPDDPGNSRDRLFRPELTLRMPAGGPAAAFDFVLDMA
jgi:protocatechuate 3,4-dioxygenase beta subunit